MTILLLVRHGRTTANASGILAGRTAGVFLDQTGQEQARAAGQRMAGVPVTTVVSSPLERCRQTAEALCEGLRAGEPAIEPAEVVDEGVLEVDYGTWSGKALKDLAGEKLWGTVQTQPSAVRFPDGESMPEMSHRAVAAIRNREAAIRAAHGPHAVWAVVSHGDIIKAILADALGMHLDAFQRLMVNPASISVISYTDARPYVLAMNTTSGALVDLVPKPPQPDSDQAQGGTGQGENGQQAAAEGEPGTGPAQGGRADDAPIGGGLGTGT